MMCKDRCNRKSEVVVVVVFSSTSSCDCRCPRHGWPSICSRPWRWPGSSSSLLPVSVTTTIIRLTSCGAASKAQSSRVSRSLLPALYSHSPGLFMFTCSQFACEDICLQHAIVMHASSFVQYVCKYGCVHGYTGVYRMRGCVPISGYVCRVVHGSLCFICVYLCVLRDGLQK